DAHRRLLGRRATAGSASTTPRARALAMRQGRFPTRGARSTRRKGHAGHGLRRIGGTRMDRHSARRHRPRVDADRHSVDPRRAAARFASHRPGGALGARFALRGERRYEMATVTRIDSMAPRYGVGRFFTTVNFQFQTLRALMETPSGSAD